MFRKLILLTLVWCPLLRAQQIAITFDDLPSHGELPAGFTRMQVAHQVLAVLKREKLPPVYGFINGQRVDEKPDLIDVLRVWRSAKQPLGNHAWSHPGLNETEVNAYTQDIAKNESLLASLMKGEDWHWFRYPFLWEGATLEKRDAVRAWLGEHRYHIAQVTQDFEDYLWNAPYARCLAIKDNASITWLEKTYLETADQYMRLGETMSTALYGRQIPHVLLMHLGAFDAKMLPELIAYFRKRGYHFVTLQQAEKDEAYRHNPNIGLKYGGTLMEQEYAARGWKVPANHKPYKELEAICR